MQVRGAADDGMGVGPLENPRRGSENNLHPNINVSQKDEVTMAYCNHHAPCTDVEKLMDISTTLADFTQSAELAAEIPAYLSRIINLETITLAVVRQSAMGGRPEIALLSSSGALASDTSASFASHVLEIHQQTRSLTSSETPILRSPFAVDTAASTGNRGFSEVSLSNFAAFPRAMVFARTVDERHRMCLIIHEVAGGAAPSDTQIDAITLVSRLLAKLLRCMMAWQDRPEILGTEFERLTDREWVVLRGLNSDDGEKQLADRLGLSPHTLHSHIKSIYRKVGVQGRLPLLQRLNSAVRELRRASINSAPPARVESKAMAVAAG